MNTHRVFKCPCGWSDSIRPVGDRCPACGEHRVYDATPLESLASPAPVFVPDQAWLDQAQRCFLPPVA